MGFMNIHEILLMDKDENLYRIYKYEKKIKLTYYDKLSGKTNVSLIIDDCLDEYDAAISKNDIVYLICQKIDKSVILISIDKESYEKHILADEFKGKLINLNIRVIDEQTHIIYCVESEEENEILRIYHHYLLGDIWKTHVVSNIRKREIINPISIVETDGKLIISYYDIADNNEQIFISLYDIHTCTWSDKVQITADNNMKIYLDMISYDNKEIDLCYSQFIEGNFVVKYEKYNISGENLVKQYEHVLSNPANCMYPNFVYSRETLWITWIEYNSVLSCFSNDSGLSFSPPYIWESSKRDNFARYKFLTNNISILNDYRLNYTFGTYGEDISFIGFGDIKAALEVPLKSQLKKKDEDENMIETEIKWEKEVNKMEDSYDIQKEIKELNEKITKIENDLLSIKDEIQNIKTEHKTKDEKQLNQSEFAQDIDKRLAHVEMYLNRRGRGFTRG